MRSLPLECLLTMFSLALHLYFQIVFCFIVLHAECAGKKKLEKKKNFQAFLACEKASVPKVYFPLKILQCPGRDMHIFSISLWHQKG